MLNPLRIFASPQIEVEWDDVVRNNLKPIYRTQNNARVPIRLFDLLKELGSVQSKRLHPSLMKSMMDYDYLFDLIENTPELKLRITDIKAHLGSEFLTVVSGDMGIGLSVVVTSQLFDVDKSTICKIIGTGRRPDWKCLLKDGRVMLVEAKGSTSKTTSNSQLTDAVDQKNHYQGDIRIATAALLNETVSSRLKIVDPPVVENGGENMRHVFRANHYASVFSFMGADVMSLYFEKMAKRLSGVIMEAEMDDKELMYNELRYNAPSLRYGGKYYSGQLFLTGENQYVFLGVDKRLLSYRGFMEYEDTEEEQMREYRGNEYVVYTDGILIVNVKNTNTFFEENHMESVGLGYEHIALSDIDSIRGSSFKRYVKYLLEKCGGVVDIADDGNLHLQYGKQKKVFVIYHVQKTGNRQATWKQIEKAEDIMAGYDGIIVTNLWMHKIEQGFKCIDRKGFEAIANARGSVDVVREVLMLDK